MDEPKPDPDVPTDADGKTRRLTDDSLSLFFIIGALLLAGMYALERWHEARVAEGARAVATHAAPIEATLPGCEIGSAGGDGRSMVVACEGRIEAAIPPLREAWSAAGLSGIEEVVLRGDDGAWRCPPRPAGWLSECEELAKR